MGWIENNGVHINMDLVRSFWRETESFNAFLCLDYGNGDVVKIEDLMGSKYYSACIATGQEC